MHRVAQHTSPPAQYAVRFVQYSKSNRLVSSLIDHYAVRLVRTEGEFLSHSFVPESSLEFIMGSSSYRRDGNIRGKEAPTLYDTTDHFGHR